MGKRSNYKRRERDFYPTPMAAVVLLIPHLRDGRTFAEPCCGDGALVRHLESFGFECVYQGDIANSQDALAFADYGEADYIITNPPYTRPVMHALIAHFRGIAPTWLLLELDWCATKQAVPYLRSCTDVVNIGRLKLIPGSADQGKENFAWCRFEAGHVGGPVLHAWKAVSAHTQRCAHAADPMWRTGPTDGSAPELAGSKPTECVGVT